MQLVSIIRLTKVLEQKHNCANGHFPKFSFNKALTKSKTNNYNSRVDLSIAFINNSFELG